MRYARVLADEAVHWAEIVGSDVILLDSAPFDGGRPDGARRHLDSVRLLAPVVPSKIYCVGRNYAAHRAEMGYTHDGAPSVFMKGPTTVIGPEANIVLPPATLSTHVEHEAELAVVIGRTARSVTADDADEYIFGYTCANDVSARDLKRSDPQPTRGKGFDTFCPVGPWIESEIDPTAGVRLRCRVGDELRQEAMTSAMTYPVPFLIEYLSAFATLLPGDLILTGSPGGCQSPAVAFGNYRYPPSWRARWRTSRRIPTTTRARRPAPHPPQGSSQHQREPDAGRRFAGACRGRLARP